MTPTETSPGACEGVTTVSCVSESTKKLVELTSTPVFVQTFKFGKYKGENIEDVAKKDANYLNWMIKNMELDEDMQYTLNMVLKN